MLCFSGRKLVAGLSACKRHLGISFFRGTELPDRKGLFNPGDENNTNIRSINLTTLEGFDGDALRALLRAAVELDADPTLPPAPKVKRKQWPMPAFFQEALAKRSNTAAATTFKNFAPTYQREYLVWVSQAKRPETRERLLKETLAALKRGHKWIDRKKALQ
jgi:uncharacterized protein YdeI (YjbR/CyaY-like superfamily)